MNVAELAKKNPLEMLFHWAKEKPNAPFLHQPIDGDWHVFTWSQVADQVASMATALRTIGLKDGDCVAISGKNTAQWFMADLAISMAGLVSVGLYPKQSKEHISFILEHSEAKAIFLGPMPDMQDFLDSVPTGTKLISMPYDDVPVQEYQWDTLVAENKAMSESDYKTPETDTLMTLVYTSGTTGNPKGVMITFGNMMFAARGLMMALPPQGEEHFFSYLPLAHAFERGAVELTSLYFGGQVHFLEDITKLAEQLKQVAPTRFFGVPLVYSRIQSGILKKMPQKKLDRLLGIPIIGNIVRKKILAGVGLQRARMCFAGAAPSPIPMLEWFEKLGVTIYQGYGMTENSIYATSGRPGQNRIGAVGKEMPDANMKISSDGEILFKHPAVMKGYYKQPDKTEETFTEDGYLRTGDRGYVDPDGYLFITGRVKDIFKTLKGKYVAPAPIEGALSKNEDIDQLCFIGTGLKQPIMVATLTPEARRKPKADVEKGIVADMEEVNQKLEPHEQIAKVVILKDDWTIDNGMMTPTMKVKRNEIEKRFLPLIEKESLIRNKIAWEA